MHRHDLLTAAADHAAAYLDGLPDARVGPAQTDPDALREALGGPLPEAPSDPRAVLDALVAGAGPGLMASQSPRFFGFVFGGALPAALAADWLASAWDQNAVLYVAAPAAAVAEEVVGGWLAELLGVPAAASFAITTGCQMAHATGLAAARHAVLARAGWDVEARGLAGAPPICLLANGDLHVTVLRAVRLLGLGTDSIVRVDTDAQGSMRPAALREALAAADGPAIVCAQAGEVNTRRLRPAGRGVRRGGRARRLGPRRRRVRPVGGGRALAATPRGRRGARRLVGHRRPQMAQRPLRRGLGLRRPPAMRTTARSAPAPPTCRPAPATRWTGRRTPRAARARSRSGQRCARSGARGSRRWSSAAVPARGASPTSSPQDGVEVLNDVVLNQVLVRFGDDDATTDAVVAAVQAEGTCWMGPTAWRGRRAMRISVSNWATTFDDVDRSCAAVLAAARDAASAP